MKRIALALLLSTVALPAFAADNLLVTPGAGATIRMRDTTGAGGPLSSYVILGDLTGTSILSTTPGTSNGNILTIQGIAAGTPIPISGSVTSITNPVTVAQPTAANLNATVVGTGTFAVQAAPNTAATWGLGATGAGVPGNAIYNAMNVGGTLTGLTGTGTSLNVNCTAGCAGAGGTSSNFGSAFPTPGTAIGLATTSPSSGNMIAWAATTNYGTAPAAIPVPALNAFVTNANANGRAVSNSSSPTVLTPALLTYHVIWPANSTGILVLTGARTLYSCQVSNNSTTMGFLKIYNKATAPTTGTDIPIKTLIIPGPSAGGGGSNIIFGSGGGLTLSLGLGVAVTGLITDADTTAPAAATFAINCDYE